MAYIVHIYAGTITDNNEFITSQERRVFGMCILHIDKQL